MSSIYEFLKGDYPGHPFRGNQWTNGGARSASSRSRSKRPKKVKTAYGLVDIIPPSKYVMSGGLDGNEEKTYDDLRDSMSSRDSSVSQAVNPLTGYRMTITEMGDTFEQIILQHAANRPTFKSHFGSGLRHMVGRAKQNKDRRGALDLVSTTHGFEVKSINMNANDPKVSITAKEVLEKAMAVKELGKKGGILIPVFDDQTATVHLHAFDGPFAPTQKNRLQIRYNKGSGQLQKVKTGNTFKIGSFQISQKEWAAAQYKAGWLRDKNGKRINPDTQTMSGAHKRGTSRKKSTISKNDIEEVREPQPGDVVISLAEDGTPYVAWLEYPGLTQATLDTLS